MSERHTIQWSDCFGDGYALDYKVQTVLPMLEGLEAKNGLGLGEVILDVGSAKLPYLRFLHHPKKIIAVDIAGAVDSRENVLGLQLNIAQVLDESSLEVRAAVAKVASFLGVQCEEGAPQLQQVDTVHMSEILNYIDYPAVLQGLKKYVKPDGKLVIVNKPGRGYDHLFSEQAPEKNQEVIRKLEALGFRIRVLWYDPEGFNKEKRLLLPDSQKYFTAEDYEKHSIQDGDFDFMVLVADFPENTPV